MVLMWPLCILSALASATGVGTGRVAACEASPVSQETLLLQREHRSKDWRRGTWTTGYWDCCKPSCSWANKGKVNRPTLACDIATGSKLADANVPSVCNGGPAASCADNQ